MTVRGIADNNTGVFAGRGAAPGRIATGPSIHFAAYLEKTSAALDVEAKQQAAMKQRIAEVGIAQYTHEQRELKKLMRVLDLLQEEAKLDIKEQLKEIISDLKQNPPRNVDEVYQRLETVIAAIPDNAPDMLKQRMKDVFRKIKQMMAQPDAELDRLEKLQRSGTLDRSLFE